MEISVLQEQLLLQSISDLEKVVLDYPYFSDAQIVLAKKYFDAKHISFTQQLPIASIHASNRKTLYEFIHFDFATVAKRITTSTENALENTSVETQTIEETKLEINETIASIASIDSLKVNTSIENEEAAIAIKEIRLVQLEKIKEITIPIDRDLQNDKAEIEEIKDPLHSTQLEEQTISPLDSVLLSNNVVENNERETIHKEEEKQAQIESGTFLEWLLQKNIETPVVQQTISIEKYTVDEEEKTKTSNKKHGLITSKEILIEKSNKIIANFIQNEPRITPGKAKFYSPAEKAKASITADENLVSETLVLIYVKQGNYKLAIKALDKLILKYPEKSTYFASQIEKIKQHIVKNNIK